MIPRIAVVGDIMTDIDLHCSCDRLCQEGPWPIFRVTKTTERPGGAANVNEMCKSLGAETILIGFDKTPSRKTRIFVEVKLTGPRIDDDTGGSPSVDTADHWLSRITEFRPNAIIVADHGKGVVTERLMTGVLSMGLPVFIDPVKSTPISLRSTCIVGSQHEIPQDDLRHEILIVKKGAAGLVWWDQGVGTEIPTVCTNCVDSLGAGDQFISTLAMRRVLGDSWSVAIEIANLSSGMQCERHGCVPVTMPELMK